MATNYITKRTVVPSQKFLMNIAPTMIDTFPNAIARRIISINVFLPIAGTSA